MLFFLSADKTAGALAQSVATTQNSTGDPEIEKLFAPK